MTRDIDYQISVMQAFKYGKEIECKLQCESDDGWSITYSPSWDWYNNDYRVKEEQKYVPYENTEEMLNDFCERFGTKRTNFGEPFIWLRFNNSQTKCLVTELYEHSVIIGSEQEVITLPDLFSAYTYLDGSSVGKLKE